MTRLDRIAYQKDKFMRMIFLFDRFSSVISTFADTMRINETHETRKLPNDEIDFYVLLVVSVCDVTAHE